jgi:hypothetical protein
MICKRACSDLLKRLVLGGLKNLELDFALLRYIDLGMSFRTQQQSAEKN